MTFIGAIMKTTKLLLTLIVFQKCRINSDVFLQSYNGSNLLNCPFASMQEHGRATPNTVYPRKLLEGQILDLGADAHS